MNNDIKKINDVKDKKTTIINYNDKMDISDIIRGFIECGFSKRNYTLTKNKFNLKLNDTVKYFIPDRGPKRGQIDRILNFKNLKKYEIDKNRYFENEILILNYDKYLV